MALRRSAEPAGAADTVREDAAEERVRRAVAKGDALAVVQALFDTGALDGMTRWLRRKWGRLGEDEVDYALAAGVNALYMATLAGRRIMAPLPYLLKTAVNVASRFDRQAQQREYHDPAELESLAADGGQTASNSDPFADEEHLQARRSRALAVLRRVAQTIPQEKQRQAVEYVLDAVGAGREDVTDDDIAEAMGSTRAAAKMNRRRGLQQLERRAREMGVLAPTTERVILQSMGDSDDDTD